MAGDFYLSSKSSSDGHKILFFIILFVKRNCVGVLTFHVDKQRKYHGSEEFRVKLCQICIKMNYNDDGIFNVNNAYDYNNNYDNNDKIK